MALHVSGLGSLSLRSKKSAVVSANEMTCAGLLLIAGVAIANRDHADEYNSTLEITGALFALLAAVFLILSLVCGGASKTSPA